MSYYAGQYYGSQHYSARHYGSSVVVVVPPATYYDKLGALGYTGTLPDRQAQYICMPGVPDAMNDCMRKHLNSLGYVGGCVQEMIAAKSRAEGFSSPSEMWIIQGLIPL